MKALLLLPLLLMCSCVVMHERDASGAHATYASLGGKGAYRKGVGLIHNHEKSFRDGVVAGTMIASGYFGMGTQQAKEATSQVGLREATKQHAASEATRQAGIRANADAYRAGLGAELPGITPATPPPPITP